MAKDGNWPDGENKDVRDTYDKLQGQNGKG
jgi:hypothetical protein